VRPCRDRGGVVSDLPDERYRLYESGPNRAVAAFLEAHPDGYEIDVGLCDRYEYNATCCPKRLATETLTARRAVIVTFGAWIEMPEPELMALARPGERRNEACVPSLRGCRPLPGSRPWATGAGSERGSRLLRGAPRARDAWLAADRDGVVEVPVGGPCPLRERAGRGRAPPRQALRRRSKASEQLRWNEEPTARSRGQPAPVAAPG
jgi:hypothetical protein